MPILISITGPIAAGKNTTANALVERYVSDNRTVVVADVDDVAAMVGPPGAGAVGLWFAAHEAHGALVAQWMRSDVDAVISVGPIYNAAESAALFERLPDGAQIVRVLIDAPLSVTWARVEADQRQGNSGRREFHEAAHARYRSLIPQIPNDLSFDSGAMSATDISNEIYDAASLAG